MSRILLERLNEDSDDVVEMVTLRTSRVNFESERLNEDSHDVVEMVTLVTLRISRVNFESIGKSFSRCFHH